MRAGSARMRAVSLHGLTAAPLCAGDEVALSISEHGLARAAAWTFGAPLAGLAGGAWIGAIAGGDASSVLCGLAGLAAALGWVVRSGDRLLDVLDLRVQVAGAAPIRLPGDAGARRTLPGNGQINEIKEERS
ncbi:MAG: SoxR reducing system RseC family protein [Pseudomonadales bacterium]|nr:SoxR reducing system RseC family protein [Pseudomonadales bacterium]